MSVRSEDFRQTESDGFEATSDQSLSTSIRQQTGNWLDLIVYGRRRHGTGAALRRRGCQSNYGSGAEGLVFHGTSGRDLRGVRCWWVQQLAAHAITANTSKGSFAPVTLEQLARESGVLRKDGVTPCVQLQPAAGAGSRLLHLLTRAAETDNKDDQCVIRPFGRETSTSSFALYTFSIAVLLQALTLITFSAVADYGMWHGYGEIE